MVKNLKSILAELGDHIPGFMATQVVGMDGLAIVAHSIAGLDLEDTCARMTLLIKLVDTTVNKLNAGKVEHSLLTTERAYMLWRHLDDDYFLGIAADRSRAMLGNMLLVSRIYGERISKAMSHQWEEVRDEPTGKNPGPGSS